MPVFYVRQGIKAGEEISIPLSRILIGRSEDNNLVFPDESVDLVHASLDDRGYHWILQDLGTPGGTWVNDEEVKKPFRVFNGDILKFGKIRVEIQDIKDMRDEPILMPVTSMAEADIEDPTPEGTRRFNRWATLGVAAFIVALTALVVVWFLSSRSNRENSIPLIQAQIPTDEDVVIQAGEPFIFISEAQDKEALARVEFWVNDTLIDVKEPIAGRVVKMETLHRWSTDRTGEYVVSIRAVDQLGQTSTPVKLRVIVQ